MKEKLIEKIIDSKKNIIVDGEIISGKTKSVLIPAVGKMIENKESLFILDSKEEYMNSYYDKLSSENYNIIVINLRNMNKSENWNPFQYPFDLYKMGNKDKAQEYLEKIGNIIFSSKEDQDPFWSMSASDLFVGIVFALFEDATENNDERSITFSSIVDFFNKSMSEHFLKEYFDKKDHSKQSYIYASPIVYAPRDTRGSILAVAKQKVRLYASRESFIYLSGMTSFDIEKIGNVPTAVIFITRDENKNLNPFASMFIEQLYGILVSKHLESKFNFILDNFDDLIDFNELDTMFSSCISRNVKFYLATRSLKQIMKNYNCIISLCDIVYVRNDDIELTINNNKEVFKKTFDNFDVNNDQVKYPELNKNIPDSYIIEVPSQDKYSSKLNNSQINELIKKIDDKIKMLENQGKDNK